jgi:cysteine desulfurase / selenocysteine lyase
MGIYLDNAATTFPKPEPVYQAVDRALREIGAGPGRGGYARGIAASRLVFESRETLAEFFRIADSSRLVFTHSATEALNQAIGGLLRPGDHVVTTTMEHNSLVRPLHRAARSGVKVTWVEADRDGLVDSRKVGAAIRPETRLVALAHCSNVTGTIQPIAEVAQLVRRSGAYLLVDAAQSAGGVGIDVREMGIDLLAVPGHKGLFGPQGTGFLYVAEGVELEPLLVGGTGGQSSGPEQPTAMPERFESGTLNMPGIAGLKAGVDFIIATGLERVREKETGLVGQLLEGLRAMPEVTVHGPRTAAERCSVVSFTAAGIDPSMIGFHLDRDFDICVRVGLHCAFSAHRTIGTFPGGTVRVSPGYFNSEEDIDLFLRALRSVLTQGKSV